MIFNQTYSNLLAKLSASLINEVWVHFTSQKRKPLSEKEASEINPIIESFLKYKVIKYQKRLMHRTQSWLECLTSLLFKKIPFIYITNNNIQINNIICIYEKENNQWVVNELK